MTLKNIQRLYNINEYQGRYLLFLYSQEGKRMPKKYLCEIFKYGNKFAPKGYEPTDSIDVLVEHINKFIAKLPYDSEQTMLYQDIICNISDNKKFDSDMNFYRQMIECGVKKYRVHLLPKIPISLSNYPILLN